MFNPNILGPDVSFYQDDPGTPQQVDFVKMKAAGARFVICRAGQNAWPDSDFRYNYSAAKEAGLPRGAYFFYDSREDPIKQANLFLGVVAGDLPECGYWLDLEETYGGPYAGWGYWKLCLNVLRENRSKVGIYTAPAYWADHRPADAAALDYFKSFPLWIANFGVTTPTIPAPWTFDDAWFWQFTSHGNGLIYGAESLNIDLNLFNGTEEDFKSRFLGGTMQVIQGTALGSVYLRDAPQGNSLGTFLKAGDQIEASENQFQWLHITKINGEPVAQEATWASAGAQQQYISWQWVTLPDPIPTPIKVPFSLNVDGYKPFSGELEKL